MSTLPKPLRFIWGDLSLTEAKRFGLLAAALMLTLGPYWMLRGIREAIFIDLVGLRWQPWGKIASFIFIIPLVLLYSRLVDLFHKEKLFYVIYSIYVLIFLCVALFVANPQLSSFSHLSFLDPLLALIPGSLVGWLSYIAFESFGALAPALFWSFVASQVTTDSAKRGYGMIISLTQLGTIGGSLLVANYSQKYGLPLLIVIATLGIATVPLIITLFTKVNKHEAPETSLTETSLAEKTEKSMFFRVNKPKTGFWEGLRLLIKTPYLMGIFVITSGYEIIGTMLEFQMNILGHEVYPTKEAFAGFYARYGLFANGLALLFALMGTSFFLRKYGLRVCLLLFPIATAFVITGTRLFPILPVVFVAMIILKGLSYSLNNPAKEILYIPTSRDVKFKAKGWIDIFGARSVKASGSGINAFFSKLAPVEMITLATPILFFIVFAWITIARFVGNKHHKLIKYKKIIG